MSSTDILGKQFGPRSEQTEHRSWIQTVSHSDSVPEIIMGNKLINQQMTTKA